MPEDRLSRLVDAHYAAMFRFALGLTGDATHAADLTQQTFYAWARKGRTVREPAQARCQLFARLHREIVRFLRLRQPSVAPAVPPDDEPAGIEVDRDEIAAGIDPDSLLEALRELEPPFRAAVILFHLQHLTCQEIAVILDVPIGTVISRLNRGKAHLRTALARRTAPSAATSDFPLRHAQ